MHAYLWLAGSPVCCYDVKGQRRNGHSPSSVAIYDTPGRGGRQFPNRAASLLCLRRDRCAHLILEATCLHGLAVAAAVGCSSGISAAEGQIGGLCSSAPSSHPSILPSRRPASQAKPDLTSIHGRASAQPASPTAHSLAALLCRLLCWSWLASVVVHNLLFHCMEHAS